VCFGVRPEDLEVLVARAVADYSADIGSRVWIKPNLDRAHLIDASDERRII
jgi:hypothetical protein